MASNSSGYVPLPWNGSIVFDDGTRKSITGAGWEQSISGMGWDRFIMDCSPGIPFSVTAQKESEEGLLEVDIYANEIDENGETLPLVSGRPEYTTAPYGKISISDTCPEPREQP